MAITMKLYRTFKLSEIDAAKAVTPWTIEDEADKGPCASTSFSSK